ncbi:hypothetical protein SmJEL517_g02193 [Synchytrium microbalum]|uniref:Major facilitator superfamily (MFS) profile domain-containing protein n=1 Tax=Synchytrium microbalum TaxID=1806994 RepID=A0A507CD98_9FUNG|nr:uncharacterized protein SmJEL517_g02193 [Synchytrium microbalum]TPX35535.1 hypothetical protein SmJEL517_g02193 [Synchytrium microbalum]
MTDLEKKIDETQEVYSIDWSPEEEAAVRFHIDRTVIPLALFMYIFAFLDRVNIGNARAYSLDTKTGLGAMERDNGMSGNDYNMVLSMFFVPYCALEPFSNLALIRFRPSVWLSRIMLTWGIFSTCMAASGSYAALMTIRIFMGAAEAGLFPGVAFWLTFWYKPSEISGRISFFYGGASFATAFSGLIATGVFYMDGKGGLAAWRWIFLLEGLPSVILGIVFYFLIPDYPETCKFLSEREREIAVTRLRVDPAHAAVKVFKRDEIWPVLREWQLWVQTAVFLMGITPQYAIAYFQPTILAYLGYTGVASQWMTVPTTLWNAIGMFFLIVSTAQRKYVLFLIILSNISDRIRDRSGILICGLFITSIAFVIMATVWSPPSVAYGMLFVVPAYSATVSLLHGWVANNHKSHTARGFAMGLMNGLGGISGAIGGQIYRAADAPHFPIGNSINAGLLLASAFLAIIVRLTYVLANRKIDARNAALVASGAELTEEQKWRYTL